MIARALLAAALVTSPLSAQTVFVGAGGTVGRITTGGAGAIEHTGALVTAEAGARAGFITLTGRYAEGVLSNAAPGADGGLVEGDARLGADLAPWLSIGGGPLALSWSDASRERWVLWVAHARLTAPLVGPGVRSYVDGYHALAGTVNLAGQPAANGVAVGVDAGWSSVIASLSYEVGRLTSGSAVQNLELLSLTVRVGRP